MRKLFKGFTLAGLVITAAPALLAQKTSNQTIFGLSTSHQTAAVDAAKVKAGGAEAKSLSGSYVFNLRGALVPQGIISREEVATGTIIADGKGNITSGEEDILSGQAALTAQPLTGTYIVNADGSGTLTLTSTQFTQTFSMFAALEGGKIKDITLVETDNNAGLGGSLTRQSAVSAGPVGAFALKLAGETVETSGVPNAVSIVGNLNFVDTLVEGDVSFFVGDSAAGSSVILQNVGLQASSTTPDSFGRFTVTFTFSQPGTQPSSATPSITFVAYLVSPQKFFAAPTAVSELIPVISGSAVQ